MDAATAGAFVGAAIAQFAAVWATLIRPMKKSVEEAKAAPAEALALQKAEMKRVLERLTKVEDKADRAVTSEEFAAYSGSTTKTMNQMTEKVGILTGAVQGVRSRG